MADNRDDTGDGLRLCVLASGSKGNAVYVSDGRCAVLFDAGLSGSGIAQRLQSVGLNAQSLSAIVVSHEHSDHTSGVGVLARRYKLPVYASAETIAAVATQWGRIDDLRHFKVGTSFNIEQLNLHPFATSHDAADPAGFTIIHGRHKIGICTDLGIATGMVKHHLKGCALLVLEANHDRRMLEQGPYPWPLKQRIKSRHGHLSNEDTCALLAEIRHGGLNHVVLAHLSETNNTPEKALRAVAPALAGADGRTQLHVACQDRCSRLLTIP